MLLERSLIWRLTYINVKYSIIEYIIVIVYWFGRIELKIAAIVHYEGYFTTVFERRQFSNEILKMGQIPK